MFSQSLPSSEADLPGCTLVLIGVWRGERTHNLVQQIVRKRLQFLLEISTVTAFEQRQRGLKRVAEQGGSNPVNKVHVHFPAVLGLYLAAVLTREKIFYPGMGGRGEIHAAGSATLLRPSAEIYRVAPNIEGKFTNPHNAGDHRSGMDADAQLRV